MCFNCNNFITESSGLIVSLSVYFICFYGFHSIYAENPSSLWKQLFWLDYSGSLFWFGNTWLWKTLNHSILGAEEKVKTSVLPFMLPYFLKFCVMKRPISCVTLYPIYISYIYIYSDILWFVSWMINSSLWCVSWMINSWPYRLQRRAGERIRKSLE